MYAQKPSGFKVGINVYPHQFFKINTTKVCYVRDQQNIPNGISFGVSIAKEWNTKWGVKTGLDYSHQNEKTYVYETYVLSMDYNFTYYKIPLSVEYSYRLRPKTYLSLMQGGQFSWLKYFKGVHTNYDLITTVTPSGDDVYSAVNPDYIGYYPADNWQLHGRALFGIVGSMGIKGDLSAKTTYSASIRYEYDISSADKQSYFSFGEFEENITSHNFRIGLALEVQYTITPKRKVKSSTDCKKF